MRAFNEWRWTQVFASVDTWPNYVRAPARSPCAGGRPLSRFATAFSSLCEYTEMSVPFGKCCHCSPSNCSEHALSVTRGVRAGNVSSARTHGKRRIDERLSRNVDQKCCGSQLPCRCSCPRNGHYGRSLPSRLSWRAHHWSAALLAPHCASIFSIGSQSYSANSTKQLGACCSNNRQRAAIRRVISSRQVVRTIASSTITALSSGSSIACRSPRRLGPESEMYSKTGVGCVQCMIIIVTPG